MLCSATLKLWLVLLLGRDGFAGAQNGAIWGTSGLLLASFCENCSLARGGRGGVLRRELPKAEGGGGNNQRYISSRGSLRPSSALMRRMVTRDACTQMCSTERALAFPGAQRIR